jgi:hypothetical protein
MRSIGSVSYQIVILGLASIGAFFVAGSPARSADLTVPTPVVETSGEFRAFVSGGAFWTDGDPIPYGTSALDEFGELLEIDPTVAPNVGWNAGAGFDYRFPASPWHINGQFRYGQAKGSGPATSDVFSESGTDDNGNPETESGSANTSASLTETHWLVDFGAGYDLQFGHNPLQVNFGVRVVNLTSDLTTPATFAFALSDPMAAAGDPTSETENASSVTTQKSSFLGAGPRVGVEGSVPFGKFSFDYAADAAWLIGDARINSESTANVSIVSLPLGTGETLSESGITSGSTYQKTVSVYNGDFLVGLSYWFTPAFKITLDYRLDAYFSPLRTYDINGAVVSLDRYYQGPEIALTAKF